MTAANPKRYVSNTGGDEKTKKSFVRTMSLLMRIQTVTIILLLVIYTANIYYQAEKETDSVAAHFMDIYGTQMESRLQKVNTQMTMILGEGEDLQLLSGDDEAQRVYASIRLSNYMNNIIKIDQSAEMFVVSEPDKDICIDVIASEIPIKEKDAIRNYFSGGLPSEMSSRKWELVKISSDIYLCRAFSNGYYVIAAILSLDEFMRDVVSTSDTGSVFAIAGRDNIVRAWYGNPVPEFETGVNLASLETGSRIRKQISLAQQQISVSSFTEKTAIIHHLYLNALIVLGVILLLLTFDMICIRIGKKQLVLPMKYMVEDMEQIGKGNLDLRVKERGNSQEFSLLSGTFNQLMDEIVNLKIRFYEKRLELSDAEQKYIRLQIRPHFFLNAMTTISGLNTKGKTEEINSYIQSLSKNIRYMFQSGLHTVSIKEETEHVKNYFEMQELRYPGALFYFIDLPGELENWKIPQMLLHTLVENEYKYAISQDMPLMVLIRISRIVREDGQMLLIEMEDDGKGYPEDVLNYMNYGGNQRRKDGTRVGLWSIKRLLELMYDRPDLMVLSNVEPHGAMNRICIPEQAVHECGKDFMEEKGIQ